MRYALKSAVWHAVRTRYGLQHMGKVDAHWAALLHDHQRFPEVEAVVPVSTAGWAISPALARFLARVVVDLQPRTILEFGAGSSSLVLAHALALVGGGQLTSVEQMPAWCADQWAQVETVSGVNARLLEAVNSRP